MSHATKTLTISLPAETEGKLKERALAVGQDVSRYLEQLIDKELAAPLSLVEAAEPFARAVDAAGVSEDEFTSVILDARNALHHDRSDERP